MDEFAQGAAPAPPTPHRPLLGLTVLVVEDSRFACEALRLLCLRSGARIRRADCLASARRHLQTYRPSVVIVDMGLPDGNGAELIEELAAAAPRLAVILAMSGDTFAEDLAIAAGADGFLAKPVLNLADFQQAILSRLPPERRPRGLWALSEDMVEPDPHAYRDDLSHAAETLSGGRPEEVIDYVAQFLGGIARSARDMPLARAAEAVTRGRESGRLPRADIVALKQLVQSRLAEEQTI
ncbi:response regulator [Shimia sp.]|uniref:response regulator n=1 Tax=Shimia sp. TaxID=1954381 RepID=UPI003565C5AE